MRSVFIISLLFHFIQLFFVLLQSVKFSLKNPPRSLIILINKNSLHLRFQHGDEHEKQKKLPKIPKAQIEVVTAWLHFRGFRLPKLWGKIADTIWQIWCMGMHVLSGMAGHGMQRSWLPLLQLTPTDALWGILAVWHWRRTCGAQKAMEMWQLPAQDRRHDKTWDTQTAAYYMEGKT